MAKATKVKRKDYLGIRFNADEFKVIQTEAKSTGIPMSAYTRMIIREKLKADGKIK